MINASTCSSPVLNKAYPCASKHNCKSMVKIFPVLLFILPIGWPILGNIDDKSAPSRSPSSSVWYLLNLVFTSSCRYREQKVKHSSGSKPSAIDASE